MRERSDGKDQCSRIVMSACIIACAWISFLSLENLTWHLLASYPPFLAQKREVNSMSFLTRDAIWEMCRYPLAVPDLRYKENGVFVRCGSAGISGVYQIQLYHNRN